MNDSERLAQDPTFRRGTAQPQIKEAEQSVKMMRLPRHRFAANEVRLWLSVIAYNLGNLWWRVLPARTDNWPLINLRRRVLKTGGRLES